MKLPVEYLSSGDAGRLLVRLNYGYRQGVARYGIVRLSNNANGKSLHVLMLGHDRTDAIFMPYHIRATLGVEEGDELDFDIQKVGLFGKLYWYVSSPDPAVHIPALIAVAGLILAVIGIVAAVLPLLCQRT